MPEHLSTRGERNPRGKPKAGLYEGIVFYEGSDVMALGGMVGRRGWVFVCMRGKEPRGKPKAVLIWEGRFFSLRRGRESTKYEV